MFFDVEQPVSTGEAIRTRAVAAPMRVRVFVSMGRVIAERRAAAKRQNVALYSTGRSQWQVEPRNGPALRAGLQREASAQLRRERIGDAQAQGLAVPDLKIGRHALAIVDDAQGQFARVIFQRDMDAAGAVGQPMFCLLYTSPSPRDRG